MTNIEAKKLEMLSARVDANDRHALKVIAAQKKMKVQEIIAKLVADYVKENKASN